MLFRFYKFQANGNDFILLDDRKNIFPQSNERIARLCHRHFGIGADGLMLLKASGEYDFEMLYFNADGQPAEMCGNGGRSIAALAYSKGIAGKTMRFLASDGLHEACVEGADTERRTFDVSLKMQPVPTVQWLEDGCFLNTGVPHFVCFVPRVEEVDVEKEGRALRKDVRFAPAGTNVNFVEIQPDRLFVRTYERGVEGETLSCGTGVTASAIAASFKMQQNRFRVHTRGGDFQVRFQKKDNRFEDVWLRGPAQQVFEGEISF
jgi:diaminopimelate epimerase